jgi:hypothetical protein
MHKYSNAQLGRTGLSSEHGSSSDSTIREETGNAQSVNDTLFAIVTHKFDRAVYRHIERVRKQLGRDYPFIVYYDATSVPDLESLTLDYPLIPFDFEKIRAKFPHLTGSTIVPGNTYAVYIDLLPAFPHTKYFWFVEYDVRFSGNWRTLVDICGRSDADMLGCYLRTREEIPDWDWWPSLWNKRNPQAQILGIRAFLWASRFSRRALSLLSQRCIEDGWTGHVEVLVPSLLHDAGMVIEEIGGRGPFTPEVRQGLFYSSEYGISLPSRNGDFGLGSNRYAPPLLFCGIRRDRLYHPVKTNRSLEAIKGDLFSLLAYKKNSAVDLLKSVIRYARSR